MLPKLHGWIEVRFGMLALNAGDPKHELIKGDLSPGGCRGPKRKFTAEYPQIRSKLGNFGVSS
jgi:hypothetical protein